MSASARQPMPLPARSPSVKFFTLESANASSAFSRIAPETAPTSHSPCRLVPSSDKRPSARADFPESGHLYFLAHGGDPLWLVLNRMKLDEQLAHARQVVRPDAVE